MTILLVEPEKPPRKAEIPHNLKAMQDAVGGLIEAVSPFEEPIALVCNEEGKMLGLPWNRPLVHPETGDLYDIICGTFFLCSAPPNSAEFDSLNDDQIARYSAYFGGGDNLD